MTSASRSSDSQLMAAVGAGDTSRLAILFERHHRAIFHFLRRSSGNAGLAEDLTQDVFLRVLRYRSSFNARHEFRPWIFRIARNLLNDHMKGLPAADQHESADLDLPDHGPSPLRAVVARQEFEQVESAIASLSPDQREALILARFHDLSYREIARILECTEGAVKARVFRALQSLAKRLDERTE